MNVLPALQQHFGSRARQPGHPCSDGRAAVPAPVDAHERCDECGLHAGPVGRRDAGRLTRSDSRLDDGNGHAAASGSGKSSAVRGYIVAFAVELCEPGGDLMVVAGGSGGVDFEEPQFAPLRAPSNRMPSRGSGPGSRCARRASPASNAAPRRGVEPLSGSGRRGPPRSALLRRRCPASTPLRSHGR